MTKSGYKFFGIRYIFSLDFTYISLCHFKNNLILVTALQIDITPKQYFLYLQSYNKVPVDHFICKKKRTRKRFRNWSAKTCNYSCGATPTDFFPHSKGLNCKRIILLHTVSTILFFLSIDVLYTKEVNLDCMGR